MSLEMLERYDDWELVPDPNATSANATEGVEVGAGGEAAKSGDEGLAADAAANGTAANSSGTNGTNSSMVRVKVERERKRLHYVTLKVAREVLGSVSPISAARVSECIGRNLELLRAEQERRANAEAKNAVESFVVDTRDKLSSDELVATVSTEEEREKIRAEFETVEDWLYEDGRDLTAAAYAKRRKELSAMTSPIFLRRTELDARPKAVEQAAEALNWTLTILETWATERPEVTEEERERVRSGCANFTEWLDAVQAEQAALAPTDRPAFLSSEVGAKLEPIERDMRRLIKKPKPKPPKVKKNATATNGTVPNGTEGTGTEGTGTEAEAEAGSSSEAGADDSGADDADGGDGSADADSSSDSTRDEL